GSAPSRREAWRHAPLARCAPSPLLGRELGRGGHWANRETVTPHPTPLPMGEGADRDRGIVDPIDRCGGCCVSLRRCSWRAGFPPPPPPRPRAEDSTTGNRANYSCAHGGGAGPQP